MLKLQFIFIGFLVVYKNIAIPAFADGSTIESAIVNGDSMAPTLVDGEKVQLLPLTERTALVRQQLVLISFNQRHRRMVKRIFAVPGDQLQIIHHQLHLNGKLVEPVGWPKDYRLRHQQALILKKQLARYDGVIPQNQFVVLGDNLRVSKDSLVYGLVRRSQLTALVKKN